MTADMTETIATTDAATIVGMTIIGATTAVITIAGTTGETTVGATSVAIPTTGTRRLSIAARRSSTTLHHVITGGRGRIFRAITDTAWSTTTTATDWPRRGAVTTTPTSTATSCSLPPRLA